MDRYVALGLARARTPWFSEVSRWATSGLLAVEFVKTVSPDELRTRLRSGRRFSVLLIDGSVPGVDRDLLELASEHDCTPIVVSDDDRDWRTLGAAATLPDSFDRGMLESVLVEWASPVSRADDIPGQVDLPVPSTGFRARTIAVTGAGGVGRSTVAMALAQGMAADVRHTDNVVLADLCLHAEQGVLHDAHDVIPGLMELVEAHRSGLPSTEEVRSTTFDVVDRRYRLLLGLRRHREWTALRPRALRAALDGLRRAFTLVISDVDADLEGETDTGSTDVEDRNILARTTVALADVVVLVGTPGIKGAHSLLRVLRELLATGVEPERIVPIVNRAPRGRRGRIELSRTIDQLVAASHPGISVLSPSFLPERRGLDDVLRDGVPLPESLVAPVTRAVAVRLDAVDERALTGHAIGDEPVPVVPGSLGSWNDDDDEVAG